MWTAIAAVLALVLIVGIGAAVAPLLPKPVVAASRYPVPSVKGLNGDPAKEAAVTLTDCAAMSDGSGWVATGHAKNSGKTERAFVVTVFFSEGDAAVNFAQSRITIPAGKTQPWAAPKQFSVGTAKLTCKVVAVN
jgi:hypothetical protein